MTKCPGRILHCRLVNHKPEVDSRMEAVIWMSEAVRLGHEIAEVQFYKKAMGCILRPDPSKGNLHSVSMLKMGTTVLYS